VGKGGDGGASRDLFQHGLLPGVAGAGNRLGGQHRAAQQGFQHQAAAQGFEDHRDVETAAAEAAVFLAQQCADDAQFGEFLQLLGRETLIGRRDAVARLEVVLFGDVAVQAVRQHAPFFSVFEVHVSPLTVRGSSWR
jgi:hypothetical protein